MDPECSWSDSEAAPFFNCHLQPSNSSPESINAIRISSFRSALDPLFPSVIVSSCDNEPGTGTRSCNLIQGSHSLSDIAASPLHRARTYSNNYTMPAYGPDGRTLVKGATITTTTLPADYESSRLDRRYGRSCDLSDRQLQNEDAKLLNNPIAQVSSDILRVSGYSTQYRSLLTSRLSPRRESGPCVLLQNVDAIKSEKCNGGVQFENVTETEPQNQTPTATRVVRRRQSGYGIAITSESTAKMRFRLRKQLFIKRNKVCDYSLALALIGLILIVIDSELTANPQTGISKDHIASLLLRSLCALSTIILVGSLIFYHAIEIKIALIDSGADDWRIAFTTERMVKLIIEIAICIICPVPGTGTMEWPIIHTDTRRISRVDVPVDVLLSVPMFLRLYLLCRFMVLHSKQFQDAATRSIAALNRISMDFRFVIKTMMADHPLRVLVVFTVAFWICMAWMFTQCERAANYSLFQHNPSLYTTYDDVSPAQHYYANSIWFIIVTFMSIGYGDIVPNTYCGRTLSITTGIVGAGVSSALIAVISRKLELSKPEKHVNNFMSDSKLSGRCRNAAASVLQNIWWIHKYKKSPFKGDELKLRQHQRKFLQSINDFRRIKWEQRRLQEKGNSLIDVGKLQNDVRETLWEIQRMNEQLAVNQAILTQQMVGLQQLIVRQQNNPEATNDLALIQISDNNAPVIDEPSNGDSTTTQIVTA